MNKLSVRKSSLPQPSGDQLVAEFQSGLTNLVTMDVAAAEAARSEADITNALQYSNPGNGVFLSPNDLDPNVAETLVKTSVDAHIKKVQAAQISSYATSQVNQQEQTALNTYKGRKVRLTNLSDSNDVFIPLWQNSQTGQMREGTYKDKVLTGTIEDLSIEKNLLVIKPTLLWRTIQPGRKYFLVQVINMQTLQPNIRLQLA